MFGNKSLFRFLFVGIFLLILLFIPGEPSIAVNVNHELLPGDWWESLSYDVINPDSVLSGGNPIAYGQSCDPGGCDVPLDEETYQQYLKPVVYPEGMSRAILPTSYDARDAGIVTSPKNQAACGGCWAFASVGAMESHMLALGVGGTPDYSEQQLISCHTGMSGCCGGSLTAMQYWETAGPITETCLPYGEASTSCPTESTIPCSNGSGCTQLNYRVTNWHTVSTSEFKDSLYVDGPSYWRFTVYDDFTSWYNTASSGSVYTNAIGTNSVGGHAVLLIGWDDTKSAYLLKNSWGATSGPQDDGTFWMAYSGHAHDLSFQMSNFDVEAVQVGDSYEPDDSAAEANLITSGSPQTHSIVPIGDEDWVTFTLATESSVTLETSGPGGDTRMWLYDSVLTEVEYNDDGGDGLFSYIDRVCDADALPAGTYYVKVDEYNNDNEIASYDLSFNAEPCQEFKIFIPLVVGGPVSASDFNGDFELGHTAWTESSSSGDDLITNAMPVTPHSGLWLAKFGVNDNETDQLSQVVTIPVDRPYLHFWYWIPSADTDPDFDYFDVKINNNLIKQITLYSGTVTTGWVEDVVDLSVYAGSAVIVDFIVTTDIVYPSIVYLDDVSLESTGSTGFNSQFNGDATGWEVHSGTWYVNSDFLYTDGVIGTSSSVGYAAEAFDDFDYQVRMWRYGSDTDANRILVRGTPEPLQTGNYWYSYYSFQFTRDGYFSVFKRLADGTSTALQGWTTSSAINTGDNWNTLRVVADGSNLYFYINGTLVWSGTDSSLSSGRVGIGMYRSDDGVNDDLFYVEWATLSTLSGTSSSEGDTVSAEQQLLNQAANQNPVGDIDSSE